MREWSELRDLNPRFADVARVVDLTHGIEPGTPAPAGFPTVSMSRFLDLDRGDPATVEILTTSLHSGTHVDAAAHMLPGGESIDALHPLALCGPAVVVDVEHPGGWAPITAEQLDAFERSSGERVARGDAVLFRTGHGRRWRDGAAYMTGGWPYVSSSAIDWLLDRAVRAIGVECADPDRVDARDLGSATFECHRRLLGAGVAIIENLARLDEISAPRVDLLVLPLRISDGSGAPVRALALLPA
jgi:arylformamidase